MNDQYEIHIKFVFTREEIENLKREYGISTRDLRQFLGRGGMHELELQKYNRKLERDGHEVSSD